MPKERLIPSPSCQLPRKALEALEKADIDEVIGAGAFAEMGHLPAASVLADALQYATTMLDGLRPGASRALNPGISDGSLYDLDLTPEDATFVGQVMSLQDLAVANAVHPDPTAGNGLTLAELFMAARGHLIDRCAEWRREPGRRSQHFRVHKGERGTLWPTAVEVGTSSSLTPGIRPDTFALFVVLPLMAPFLGGHDECFVAPRLE